MTTTDHLVGWHRRAMDRDVPLSAYLELTHRCNLDCGFCCNRQPADTDPLQLDDWIAILDQLRLLGTLYLNLTGGEPLAHPHWVEIIGAARERAFAVRLLTNATLIDAEAAAVIARARPLSVETTIHAATAEIHDRTTRRPGSFEAAWIGIDRLRVLGVNVVLKTVRTRLNEHQIDGIAGLAEARDLPLRIDPQILPRDDGDRTPLGWSAVAVAEPDIYTDLQPPPSPGTIRCGLGRSTLTIDPSGQVYPCVLWRESSYGSIREAPLEDIWRRPVRKRLAELAVVSRDVATQDEIHQAHGRDCPAADRRSAGICGAYSPSNERRVAR